MIRGRSSTHGYDHSFRHGLSGAQIAAIKAKGGFQAAGKAGTKGGGALPKNVPVPRQTTSRVNNPKVPNAPQRKPIAAPMSKKQIAAKPLPKAKAPPKPAAPAATPAKAPTPKVVTKTAATTSKASGKKYAPAMHKKSHVNVGQVLGRAAGAAKTAVQTAIQGSTAEAVMSKKAGKH